MGKDVYTIVALEFRRTSNTEIELTDEDLVRIDEAAPRGVAAGERYPNMSSVNR